jgi:hypothetical protein
MQSIQKIGLSVEFFCLACTYGGDDRSHLLSKSGEKFAAGNAFRLWRRGAVFDGALSRYLRIDWGAGL